MIYISTYVYNHNLYIDTFKLWKHGNSLRLDYNLVGINGIRAKKRDMTLLFNPKGNVLQREDFLKFEKNSKNSKKFWIINRTKKLFTNPLVFFLKKKVFLHFFIHKQEIDLEEKKKILLDILSSQPVHGNFNVKQCILNATKGGKKDATIMVGKWPTKK